MIGQVSLMNKASNNRGFWLGVPWQGHGLMSEAVEVVTDFWFDALGYNIVRATKAIANTASRRISKKHGMRVIATEERDYVAGRLMAEIWEITADEWRYHRTTRV